MTICVECRHVRYDKASTAETWRWKCAANAVARSGADCIRDRITGDYHLGHLPLCIERNIGPDDCPDFAAADTFPPNLNVEPLPFEEMERGFVPPLIPRWLRAWLRGVWRVR